MKWSPSRSRSYARARAGALEDGWLSARRAHHGYDRDRRALSHATTRSKAEAGTFGERLHAAERAREVQRGSLARAEASKIKTLERDLDALRGRWTSSRRPSDRFRRSSAASSSPACARRPPSRCCRTFIRSACASATPVPNEYNPAIAERSIARFFAGYRWLIDFHRSAFQIRDVVLWLGGDLMSGHIHEELKEHTATPPIETLLWLRPRLAAGIDSLLADPKIERISIPCSYGNHGRNTVKPFRALGATHSYEWLLYQWLASIYEGNPRVQFLADRSAHQYMHVYEWDLHFHHGDETNYQGGVGGVTIPLSKSVAQWDKAKRCHYHHFGHWHQYIDVGRMTVNGSVIGYNAYAMSIKAEPEPPQQAFYILDSKRGKTCKCPIWVRE